MITDMVVSIFDQYAWPTRVDCAMAYDSGARKTRRPGFDQNLPEPGLLAPLRKSAQKASNLYCTGRISPACVVFTASTVPICMHREGVFARQISDELIDLAKRGDHLAKSTGLTKQEIWLEGWSLFCRLSCFPFEWLRHHSALQIYIQSQKWEISRQQCTGNIIPRPMCNFY